MCQVNNFTSAEEDPLKLEQSLFNELFKPTSSFSSQSFFRFFCVETFMAYWLLS